MNFIYGSEVVWRTDKFIKRIYFYRFPEGIEIQSTKNFPILERLNSHRQDFHIIPLYQFTSRTSNYEQLLTFSVMIITSRINGILKCHKKRSNKHNCLLCFFVRSSISFHHHFCSRHWQVTSFQNCSSKHTYQEKLYFQMLHSV